MKKTIRFNVSNCIMQNLVYTHISNFNNLKFACENRLKYELILFHKQQNMHYFEAQFSKNKKEQYSLLLENRYPYFTMHLEPTFSKPRLISYFNVEMIATDKSIDAFINYQINDQDILTRLENELLFFKNSEITL